MTKAGAAAEIHSVGKIDGDSSRVSGETHIGSQRKCKEQDADAAHRGNSRVFPLADFRSKQPQPAIPRLATCRSRKMNHDKWKGFCFIEASPYSGRLSESLHS